MIAVCVVLTAIALKPAWNILDNLANSVAEEKANLLFLTKKEERLSILKKNYEEALKSSEDLFKALPNTKEISQFVNSLDAMGEESGIQVTQLQVVGGKNKDLEFSQTTKVGNYYTLPMKLTLDGEYDKFFPFLSKLEKEKRHADIQTLEINKSEDINQIQTVKAILDLVIYLKP